MVIPAGKLWLLVGNRLSRMNLKYLMLSVLILHMPMRD